MKLSNVISVYVYKRTPLSGRYDLGFIKSFFRLILYQMDQMGRWKSQSAGSPFPLE